MLNDLYTVKLMTACSNLFDDNNLAAFSDIKILLENGEEFNGHKLILFSQSEIWNLVELEKVNMLDLSDICQTTSYCLVRWLYTNIIPIDTDCQTLFQLLHQSFRFKIPALQHKCEKMLTSLVNEENCELFYNTAVEISDDFMIEYCQKYFSPNAHNFEKIDMNNQVMSEDEPISIDIAQIIVLDTVETDVDTSVKSSYPPLQQSADNINSSQSEKHLMKPYECDYCEKSYSKSQYLLDHIKIVHSTSKAFSCPHCAKTFTVKKSLKRHLNAHCTIILHTCNICSKSFSRKSALENHSKLHTLKPEKLISSLPVKKQPKEIIMSIFKDEGTENSHVLSEGEGTSDNSYLDTANVVALRVEGQIESDLSQTAEACTKLESSSEMNIIPEMTVSDLQAETKATKLTILPAFRKRPHKCDVCDKAFTKSNHLKDHRTVHTKVREFICDICANSFLTKTSLRQHLNIHRIEKPYKCDVCNKSFVQNRDLQNHIKKDSDCDLGRKRLYDNDVDKELKSKDIQVRTETIKDKANDANVELISEDDVKMESETVKDKHNFNPCSNPKCPICQREFFNLVGLRIHMKKAHTSDFLCNNCHKIFPSLDELQLHNISDHGDSVHITCHICSKSFPSNRSLVIHVRTHTGEKPFQCDVCPKSFRSAPVLKGHKRTHIGIKPYKCDVCNKGFSKTNHVREHFLNVHSTCRPFFCEICHKSFPTEKSVSVHVKIHNREENAEEYKCDICAKSFNHKSTLQKHLKHHIGNKDMMCDVCGKSFYDTADLNRHARIHINEPHCDICDKTFCNQEYLQKHMLAHEGVKSFICKHCDKSYLTNYNLKRHLKVCNKSKPMSE